MRRVGAIAGHVEGAAPAAASAVLYDVVLRGGSVYCSELPDGTIADVGLWGDTIGAVELPGVIPPGAGREEVDASNRLVVPGLIDIHAHIYENVMAGAVNPDEACLSRCTTTAVDCGSAGTGTLDGFVKYIAAASTTRCLAFVNMNKHGIAAHPCYGHIDQVASVAEGSRAIRNHPETVVGVKVLLTAAYANDGKTELEVYKRALELTAKEDLPLICHHSSSIIPVDHRRPRLEQSELEDCEVGCPSSLRPGDIYTHW